MLSQTLLWSVEHWLNVPWYLKWAVATFYFRRSFYFPEFCLLNYVFWAVNNAGTINKNNKVWEVPPEEFDNVIDTNIKGIANIMRHFIPLMIENKQGVIVNMSSGWGRSAAAQVELILWCDYIWLFPFSLSSHLFHDFVTETWHNQNHI